MEGAEQTRDWLAWEAELRAAITALRAAGGHEHVLGMLEHMVTVAMHNAYCSTPHPFPQAGFPV